MICLNCGRKLKSVASREAGYGPVCYRKIFGTSLRSSRSDNASNTMEIPHCNLPGQMTMDEYLQMGSE